MLNEVKSRPAGGKLIMWNVATLDGHFEGTKKWDLDFHNIVWGDELEQLSLEQLNQCNSLVFGRVTYEGMAAYWTKETGTIADLMNSIPKIVFSKTLSKADWNNTRLVKDNVEGEVAKLKHAEKDSYIFGSADLSATLMKLGLIDEYRICVAPIILGGGTPLFNPAQEQLKLHLLSTQVLKNGGVILRYQPEK
ncbi:MAG: dihydrofolate reductase family protein [Ignavibacteriae bacterium]|nr:dihydrofolate reductase family protein [Ignavibacteriota bacterium]